MIDPTSMPPDTDPDAGGVAPYSKLKMAVGAASLFFFLIGVKRSFRTEDGLEILHSGEPVEDRGGSSAGVARAVKKAG
jgi:hypothetical protein